MKNIPALGMFPFVSLEALQQLGKEYPSIFDDPTQFGNVIDAPEDPSKWPAFRDKLNKWREDTRKSLKYDNSAYNDPHFKWTQTNFSCCFLMMYDLEFYDPVKLEYRTSHIIEKGLKEFGGYDSVVLWHAYPRIGIDDRNQFDFYRDMPGGLPGIRKVVDEFHRNNIKVFINYNPWDTGTRREAKSDLDGLVDIVSAIDADGIFLDTLKNAAFDFRSKLDGVKPGIVVEGELAAELDVISSHHLSWAQEFGDKYVPGILRNKLFEPKHLQHQISRWSRDHSTELHQAWINGSGIMVWENVFGQWLPWHKRDRSTLRLMLPIQRRYADIFNSETFTPLIQTLKEGIFASLWEVNGTRIWTLINRHEKTVSGELLSVDDITGNNYYDLISGSKVQFARKNNKIVLSGSIAARSVGCFIAGNNMGTDFPAFLNKMRVINQGFNGETIILPPALANRKKIKELKPVDKFPANEMVEIKPAIFRQTSTVESRECGTYYSSPMVAVDLNKSEVFERTARISRIAIDITPVTNKQFYNFIQQTNYQPKDRTNFLKHWKNGKYPEEKANHPVVYVDLIDARAYASWAGKRLPREEEWQYASQGYSWPKYPWGYELKDDAYNNGNDTAAVDAFPKGRSSFGCLDMCSNTWELTESEYSDNNNRFCMLKGGSFYQAKGSHWYTKGGPMPSEVSTKFLMLYPGLDRCATIGFRCVMDLT